MATVPVISPEGQFGSVPQDNLNAAIQRGFKTATAVVSPEGQDGWLPMDKVHEAVGRGFKIGTSAQLAQEQAPQSGPVDTALREGVLGAASGAGLPESTNRSDFSLVPGLKQIFTHPIDSAKLLGGAVIDAGQQQQDALNRAKQAGATYPALVHAVAAGIPLVGPAAENAGEEIGRGIQNRDVGQIAHGVGSGAGLVGTLAAGTEKGSQLANEAITEVGSNVAKPIIATARRIPETIQNVKQVLNPVKNMTAEQAATKAIRPRNSKSNFPQELQTALPDARRAADALKIDPQTMTMDDALNAVNQAKKDVWGEYQNNYSDPNAAVTVDTSPVADAMRKTVSQRMTEQNPGLAKKINRSADTYDGRNLSVQDLEDRVQELNRQTRAIEAKYPVDKRAAKMSPNNAPVFAERDGLRQLLLEKMGENAPDFATANPEASAAALRQRYGNLMSVEDSLSRRLPVANRQSPKGLTDILSDIYGPAQVAKGLAQMATGVGAIHGLANVIEGGVGMKMAKNAKLMNSPDFLIQQAFGKTTARPPAVLRQILNGEYMPQEGDASQFTPGYQGNQLPSGQPRVDQLPAGQYPAQSSPLDAIFRPRQPQLQKAPSVSASRQLPAKNPIPLGPSGSSGVTNIEPVGLPFLRGNSIIAPEGQAVANAITKGAKPKQFQPQSSSNPLPFLKTQEPAPAQTGNGFLDLLNKSVNGSKRDAAIDELVSSHGLVPRGYAPEYGGYGIGIPKGAGKFNDTVVPVNEITPERLRELKANGTANPKTKGTPAPNPADIAAQQRFRLSQLQNDLAKSKNPTERAELQSAIEQIQTSLPKRNGAGLLPWQVERRGIGDNGNVNPSGALSKEQFRNLTYERPEGGASKDPKTVFDWRQNGQLGETLHDIANQKDQYRFNEALTGEGRQPISQQLAQTIKVNKPITIYRTSEDGGIVPGSYVTESKQYALDHAEANIKSPHKLYTLKVRPSELMTYGDPHEFIYTPESVDEAYSRYLEQHKRGEFKVKGK